jgi:hypothetical protein
MYGGFVFGGKKKPTEIRMITSWFKTPSLYLARSPSTPQFVPIFFMFHPATSPLFYEFKLQSAKKHSILH